MRDAPKVRRVAVREETLLGTGRPDYADAFEIRVREPDTRSAEQWVRIGLEESPTAVRWTILFVHSHVLRFRLGPAASPDHVLGWKIVESRPDVVHLEAVSPLARAMIVAQRLDPRSAMFTTALFYERPVPAHVIWAIIGPLHRRIAPYLLVRAATAERAQGLSS